MRMTKGVLFSVLVFCVSSPSLLVADELSPIQKNKLDPILRMVVQYPELASVSGIPGTALKRIGTDRRFGVLIKSSGDFSELAALGVELQSVIGDVTTGLVSASLLPELASLESVVYVESPKNRRMLLDRSAPEIGAQQVRTTFGLTGEGVIVGIVDTGIDWRHKDFRNSDGTTRIKYLLDFSNPGDVDGNGTLDGPDDFGGTLYTEEEINAALQGVGDVNQKDLVGHGTHVASCAAGNGRATGNKQAGKQFVGVAPQADLIIVKATRTEEGHEFDDVDYVNALQFIDSKASELGLPYVANISLGSSYGAHDGSDLAEQTIDNLVGRGKQGKAVVVAAGNDGDLDIHASGTLGPVNSSATLTIQISDYEVQSGTENDYIVLDCWYDGNSRHSVKLKTPGERSFGPFASGRSFFEDTNEGLIYIDNASGGVDPRNGDRELLIQVYDRTQGKEPPSGTWEVTLSGTSGRFDCWLAGSTMEAEFTNNVDGAMKVNIPATALNSITVGSYITKRSWTDIDGHTLTLPSLNTKEDGELSDFSSPGPTRDGRIKPDLAAPGQEIGAALSVDADPSSSSSIFYTGSDEFPNGFVLEDGVHGISQGTSMASPHVAGVVALAFQKDPSLTALQVRQMLQDSARTDILTGNLPNEFWGYGKVSASGAVVTPPDEVNIAPMISNVSVSEVTDTSVTITWNTDKFSDSQVVYGLEKDKKTESVFEASLVTSHVVKLDSLQEDVLYYFQVRSQDAGGNLSVSAELSFATSSSAGVPGEFWILPNYPNPFNPLVETSVVKFKYSGSNSGEVEAVVFDALGREVRRIVLGAGGSASPMYFEWDGRNSEGEMLRSGIYFIRVRAGGSESVNKVLLLR